MNNRSKDHESGEKFPVKLFSGAKMEGKENRIKIKCVRRAVSMHRFKKFLSLAMKLQSADMKQDKRILLVTYG